MEDGGGLGMLVLGIILVLAIRSSLSGFRSLFRAKLAPRPKGLVTTMLTAREQTRAKRKLAEDKEKREERRKTKEHRALMRAEERLEGKRSWWW